MKITGHGIDILNISRQELQGYRLAKRFMTKNEYEIGLKMEAAEQHHYVCAIWSLKEATIKATNHQFLFSEIEINIAHQKAPTCSLPGYELWMSLSYEKEFVIASVIAVQE